MYAATAERPRAAAVPPPGTAAAAAGFMKTGGFGAAHESAVAELPGDAPPAVPPPSSNKTTLPLIRLDKSPSPALQNLLLAVAGYISSQVHPWHTTNLTPVKLANFYRLVGGEYDALFMHTPHRSLAFIYTSLGCFHSLHPRRHGANPYEPPTVPALTPQGYVRWQTIQILLDPDDHVAFLQQAVKRFGLVNPADGRKYAASCEDLPRSAFPAAPDAEMVAWHQSRADRLAHEAKAETGGSTQARGADGPPAGASRRQSFASARRNSTTHRPNPVREHHLKQGQRPSMPRSSSSAQTHGSKHPHQSRPRQHTRTASTESSMSTCSYSTASSNDKAAPQGPARTTATRNLSLTKRRNTAANQSASPSSTASSQGLASPPRSNPPRNAPRAPLSMNANLSRSQSTRHAVPQRPPSWQQAPRPQQRQHYEPRASPAALPSRRASYQSPVQSPPARPYPTSPAYNFPNVSRSSTRLQQATAGSTETRRSSQHRGI